MICERGGWPPGLHYRTPLCRACGERMTDSDIAAIIKIVDEFLRNWGRPPTVAEVIVLLKAS